MHIVLLYSSGGSEGGCPRDLNIHGGPYWQPLQFLFYVHLPALEYNPFPLPNTDLMKNIIIELSIGLVKRKVLGGSVARFP